jgi:hypothetical protein
MATEREKVRTVEDIWEDGPWPQRGGASLPDPLQSLRHLAIAGVLCCVPPDDYERLTRLQESFVWWVPDYQECGYLRPFPCTDLTAFETESAALSGALVLYLSPVWIKGPGPSWWQ